MKGRLELLQDDLAEAEARYRQARQDALDKERDAEWANQKRYNCGQDCARIRAAIKKLEEEAA